MAVSFGCEWCWCYPLRMRRVEIQISRRGHPIRVSPKRLPNQHYTAPATLADHTDLRRRSTLYTTRHSTPIGAAKQPQYVVAYEEEGHIGIDGAVAVRKVPPLAVEVAERGELALASPWAADGEPGLGGSARRSTFMLSECNAPRS